VRNDKIYNRYTYQRQQHKQCEKTPRPAKDRLKGTDHN
jgi:hypothetical protein